MERLKGKVALITGAASGMGAAEAKLFAEEGAHVVLADIQANQLNTVTKEIIDNGGNALSVILDVTSQENWTNAIKQVIDKFGKIDILINNAGIKGPECSIEESTYEDFIKIININLNSQYLGIKAVLPYFPKDKGGSVVNISSIAGFIAFPNIHPAYAASKGGSRLLTKTIAADLAKQNIRVNSVHPGVIDTPMSDFIENNKAMLDSMLPSIPMGRVAQAIEVAKAVLFLASDDASYITGTELVVDGGYTCI